MSQLRMPSFAWASKAGRSNTTLGFLNYSISMFRDITNNINRARAAREEKDGTCPVDIANAYVKCLLDLFQRDLEMNRRSKPTLVRIIEILHEVLKHAEDLFSLKTTAATTPPATPRGMVCEYPAPCDYVTKVPLDTETMVANIERYATRAALQSPRDRIYKLRDISGERVILPGDIHGHQFQITLRSKELAQPASQPSTLSVPAKAPPAAQDMPKTTPAVPANILLEDLLSRKKRVLEVEEEKLTNKKAREFKVMNGKWVKKLAAEEARLSKLHADFDKMVAQVRLTNPALADQLTGKKEGMVDIVDCINVFEKLTVEERSAVMVASEKTDSGTLTEHFRTVLAEQGNKATEAENLKEDSDEMDRQADDEIDESE